MHPFERRLQALETHGTGSACELVLVECRLDDQGREIGEGIAAAWRDQRFERQGQEDEQQFLERVRSAVASNLPSSSARSLLFLSGSDRHG